MPNSPEHRDKAVRNSTFLNTIDRTTFPEWSVVVAFYLAVHLAERLAARDSAHHDNHKERLEYLRRKHRKIHNNFKHLYEASLVARYDTVHRFSADYSTPKVARLLDVDLTEIQSYVATIFPPKPTT